jgi:hypothetical protein
MIQPDLNPRPRAQKYSFRPPGTLLENRNLTEYYCITAYCIYVTCLVIVGKYKAISTTKLK